MSDLYSDDKSKPEVKCCECGKQTTNYMVWNDREEKKDYIICWDCLDKANREGRITAQ